MTFAHLIEDQICYGGKKYAFNKARESTDVLVDRYGLSWMVGTMNKYVFRYQNEGREKDTLKIGAYAYLFWLKTGCHCDSPYTVNGVLFDTNPENKIQFIGTFLHLCKEADNRLTYPGIEHLHLLLPKLAGNNFYENDIFSVFNIAKQEWESKFKNVSKHDTDTNGGK